MIDIRPDPARPTGGYAVLDLPDPAISGDETLVAVFDAFSERYLGEKGWQAVRADFGPYPILRKGGRAQITIGPEIVNQIEEYAALKIHLGAQSHEASWPDDVVPAPGAAVLGGLHVGRSAAAPVTDNLVGRRAEVAAQVKPAAAPAVDADPSPRPESGPRNRLPMIAGGIALILLVAALLWWQLSRPEETAIAPIPSGATMDQTEAPPPAPADPCTADALRAMGGGPFAAIADQIDSCGAAVAPETVLALMENAAEAGDADALLLFGEVYDSGAENATVEGVIGLALGDQPATAAEYYARAREAGSATAPDRLAQLCTRLADATETLAAAAFQEYCTP